MYVTPIIVIVTAVGNSNLYMNNLDIINLFT
jgi:hypothetical protein